MIPVTNDDLKVDFQFQELPTNTFFLHITKDNISGFTDQIQAMVQAIYLILNIERYEHVIYSWDYGVELADLFGKPIPFCIPEIKRRITEALIQDTRITSVEEFTFEHTKNQIHTTFVVHTIFGDIQAERTVEI
jgi:hypothetical protein